MVILPKNYRSGMVPRLISWLVRQRLTKATISSRPERVNGHIGTERKPDAATPREGGRPSGRKLLSKGKKNDGTFGGSPG